MISKRAGKSLKEFQSYLSEGRMPLRETQPADRLLRPCVEKWSSFVKYSPPENSFSDWRRSSPTRRFAPLRDRLRRTGRPSRCPNIRVSLR